MLATLWWPEKRSLQGVNPPAAPGCSFSKDNMKEVMGEREVMWEREVMGERERVELKLDAELT